MNTKLTKETVQPLNYKPASQSNFDSIKSVSNYSLFRAAVRNFYLFVAIYVWKPGIAVSCGIIFRAWGCDPVFGTAPARMNLMVWGECVVVSHCTGVDTVFRNHRF